MALVLPCPPFPSPPPAGLVVMLLDTVVIVCPSRVDLWRIAADALVHPTNENMKPRNAVAEKLFQLGGVRLIAEVDASEKCRTGEAIATSAGGLHARCVCVCVPHACLSLRCPHTFLPSFPSSPSVLIHTVGPRYNSKYRTAAENALHGCYRNSLRILKEAGLHTIAMPCLYPEERNYPRKDAAHIALRTLAPFVCVCV